MSARSIASRFRRPLTAVPVLALIGGGFWLGTRSGKASSTSTTTVIERTADVTSGPMRQTVNASGTLAPADVENLDFSVAGTVTAVRVAAGQKVAKGDVLATLDSASLASQVSQAQAAVDSAQARLATDTAAAASAAQINADNANIAADQAALTDARNALANATLTSPIDGTVAAVNLTVGQQLGSGGTGATSLSGTSTGSGRTGGASTGAGNGGAGGSNASSAAASPASGAAQVQVVSTGKFVVNLNVDDTQVGLLQAGQPATISGASAAAIGGGRGGFPGGQNGNRGGGAAGQTGNTNAGAAGGQRQASSSATGTVTSVGTIATTTSGVSTFPVVVSVDSSPPDFFAGGAVAVSVTYKEIPDVLQVPTAAITQQNGQAFVTVADGTRRTQVAVRTGIVASGETQIVSGLSEGQQVVMTIRVPAAVANNARNGTTGRGFGGGGGGFAGRPGD